MSQHVVGRDIELAGLDRFLTRAARANAALLPAPGAEATGGTTADDNLNSDSGQLVTIKVGALH